MVLVTVEAGPERGRRLGVGDVGEAEALPSHPPEHSCRRHRRRRATVENPVVGTQIIYPLLLMIMMILLLLLGLSFSHHRARRVADGGAARDSSGLAGNSSDAL